MKGPKALISSAIAEALAEYFVIDVNLVESNLLTDTKIALQNVQLKPISSTVAPENTFGNSTKVYITGVVEKVVFSWSWSLTGGGKSWVKDAVLTILGVKFKAELTQEDKLYPLEQLKESSGIFGDSLQKLNEEADTETAESIQEAGSFQTYLMNQVHMIVDALTLDVVDFEMTVEMPSPNLQSDGDNNSEGIKDQDEYTIALVAGGKRLTFKSEGRFYDVDDHSTLKETGEINSLHVKIIEKHIGSEKENEPRIETFSLMDPFSYGVEIARTHGERFSSFMNGLVVKGGQQLAGIQNEGISLHLARPQMEAFGQLSGLLLAPPEKAKAEPLACKQEEKPAEVGGAELNEGDISTFEITLGSAMMDIMGDTMTMTRLAVFCKADGTDFTAKADVFNFASPGDQTCVSMTELFASIRPHMQVKIKSVDIFYIPQVIELKKPMENIDIDLIGETWTVKVDTFYGSLPAPPTEDIVANVHDNHMKSKRADSKSVTSSSASSPSKIWVAPFPFCWKFKMVNLIKENNKATEMTLRDIEILAFPEVDRSGTRVAVSVGDLKSELAVASKMDAYTLVPANINSNTFNDFAFSAESVSVRAGYSVEDWVNTFRIGGLWAQTPKTKNQGNISYSLPFAQVAPIKIKIAYDAFNVVSVKETTFRINQFKGRKDTTTQDMLDYYIKQCLARASNFLKNSELLGLNVESAATFGLATTLGWATGFAPIVGVAAVVGVDSVRGAVEAGKRQRHAPEGDSSNYTDFFRGVGYSFVEATEKGKLRRGSKDGKGNVLDWVVGSTENTTEYIDENKDKLGAAGGGAAGVVIGTMVGGPVGGVIGGIIGGVSTGTAIRQVDKRVKDGQEKRRDLQEAKLNDNKILPGQLTLDGA
ncbi:hypothetical protein IV203_002810 [Nitzschia inconspicua]|uniref:Uncharacterized protein n=1 Tax=Nitzschia inconspicua TaxID=303405 RepID=A0A9K3PN04_9STRA|nr:hypothetical protein IV203_002810 [Nitzschia inconspicua]